MKNFLNEIPELNLHGGQAYAVNNLIKPYDLVGKELLDIGCGFGWFEEHVRKKGIKKITAMEYTDVDLETIRKFISDPLVEFSVGSAIKLPFPDESFDTVVSWEVIEHIPRYNEAQMLKEMKRVLRPGGRIYLSTPYSSLLTNLLDPAFFLTGHRHYKPSDIEKFARESALTIESMTVKGGILDSIFVINLYISKWVFRRGPFFQAFFNRSADSRYLRSHGSFQLFAELSSRK
jgi:ubiquinone/menaquinone biosynthesis C-methylase UbiE